MTMELMDPPVEKSPERLSEVARAAKEIIEFAPPRIDSKAFAQTPGYNAAQIAAHEAAADKLEEGFEANETEDALLSEALEVIFAQQATKWFKGFSVKRSSRYDDYVNKVDAIGELRGPSVREHLALGVDATDGADEGPLKTKIVEKMMQVLRRGGRKPATVEYHESPDNPPKRERLTDVIPVVIGIDKKDTAELVTLAAQVGRLQRQIKEGNNSPRIREDLIAAEKKIDDHPAQVIFLLEIQAQIDMYLGAISNETDRGRVLPKDRQYMESLRNKLMVFQAFTDAAIRNTNTRKIPLGKLAEDRTYRAIKTIIERQKSQNRV